MCTGYEHENCFFFLIRIISFPVIHFTKFYYYSSFYLMFSFYKIFKIFIILLLKSSKLCLNGVMDCYIVGPGFDHQRMLWILWRYKPDVLVFLTTLLFYNLDVDVLKNLKKKWKFLSSILLKVIQTIKCNLASKVRW